MGTRMDGAHAYLSPAADLGDGRIRGAQLRKLLELIVMGSLVTNRGAVEQITEALARKGVDDARKLVRKAKP
jgi:hypothetical protein